MQFALTNQMKDNSGIHHRKSIRLKGYDYSKAGIYFITVCTKERKCLFGKIVDEEMILNDAGKIANEYWLDIPKHFPDVNLHEHIIMPNHVHGIIELTNVGAQNFIGVQDFVRVQDFEPLQNINPNVVGVEDFQPPQNQFQKIIPHSIGSIIRGYKIGVTKWFRKNTNIYIVWQRNLYEYVIRNEQSYKNIANYIINNPREWKEDKFYNSLM
jgi:putative transposase